MTKRQVWMLTASVALMALLMAPLSLLPSYPVYLGLYALVGVVVRAKKRRSLLRPPLVFCSLLVVALEEARGVGREAATGAVVVAGAILIDARAALRGLRAALHLLAAGARGAA